MVDAITAADAIIIAGEEVEAEATGTNPTTVGRGVPEEDVGIALEDHRPNKIRKPSWSDKCIRL